MAASFCKISKLWALHLPAVWSLVFTFQCVVGSFSKDTRFLQVQAQMPVPAIILSFAISIFGLLTDSKVEPLLGGTILRIMKIFKLQHMCVWLCSLVAQAVQLQWCSAEPGGGRNWTTAFGCPYLQQPLLDMFLHMEMNVAWLGEITAQDKGSCLVGAQPLPAEGQFGSAGPGELCFGSTRMW